MQNMTVKAKLGLSFGGIAVMVMLVSGLSIKALSDSDERFDGYVQGVNARALAASGVRSAVDARAIAARNLVIVSSAEDLEKEKKIVTQAHANVTSRMAALNKLGQEPGVTDEARRLIAELDRVEKLYAPVALGIVDLALKGNREEANLRITRDCRPLLEALTKTAEEFSQYTANRSKEILEEAEARAC